MDTLKIYATKPSPESIAQIATRYGLPSNTLHVRLRRGKTWEEALQPIGSYPRRRSLDLDGYERAKTYIINYKHANSGYPPSLPKIEADLGLSSSGKARVVLENLKDQGFLRLMDQSKIGVNGERWLAPDENRAVEELVALALISEDPSLREAGLRFDAELSQVPASRLTFRAGKPAPTAYKRTKSAEDKLAEAKQFMLDFKHANGGLSPSLGRMLELMNLSSMMVARVLIDNLERDNFLKVTTEGGRFVLPGEDWLSPKENALLNRLIAAAYAVDDKRLHELAELLELEDGKSGPTFLDPLRAAAFEQLVAIVSEDGAAYRQIAVIQSSQARKVEKRAALDALIALYRESSDKRIRNLIYWLEPKET